VRGIVGAYHVATFPHWHEIVQAQCQRLKGSGLLDRTKKILVGVVGNHDEDISLVTELLGKRALIRRLGSLLSFEFPTLQWLYEEIKCKDVACWYVHTKGASTRREDQTVWRLKMESVVFDQYEKCLVALETHDTCGTKWTPGIDQHYSGNFWWANSHYLQTLPPPLILQFRHRIAGPPAFAVTPNPSDNRFEAELWIGKNPEIRECNLDTPTQPFDKPSGWVGLESKYRDLIGNIGQVKRIVELGVDYGFSLFHFALHYPDAEVIGVDNFTMHDDSEAWIRQHVHLFPNVRIIKGSTVEVGHSFCEPVDLLHIDADHGYESVAADFSAWLPVVRSGGRVLFHDTVTFPTVGKFFKELEGEKREILEHNGLGCWFR